MSSKNSGQHDPFAAIGQNKNPIGAAKRFANMISEDKKEEILVATKELKGRADKPKIVPDDEEIKAIEDFTGKDTRKMKIEYIDIYKTTDYPDHWFHFDPLNKEKFFALLEDISKNGLFHAITLWKQLDGSYMIIGGNNRKEVYRLLYETTEDDYWKYIPANVFEYEDLTEVEARKATFSTNVFGREESLRKNPKAAVEVIRLEQMAPSDNSVIKIEELAEKYLGVKRAKYYNMKKITKLTNAFLDAYSNGEIKVRVAEKLANLNKGDQEYLYKKFPLSEFTLERVKNLKKGMSKSELDMIMQEQVLKPKQYSYEIPVDLEIPNDYELFPILIKGVDAPELKKMLYQILLENKNIVKGSRDILLKQLK